jgi:hypothetical protein
VSGVDQGHDRRRGPNLQGSGLAEVAAQRDGHVHQYSSGQTFPLSECCPLDLPAGAEGLKPEAWKDALQAQSKLVQSRSAPAPSTPALESLEAASEAVQALAAARQEARNAKDWAAADNLRKQIEALGWKVIDTPQGPMVVRGD